MNGRRRKTGWGNGKPAIVGALLFACGSDSATTTPTSAAGSCFFQIGTAGDDSLSCAMLVKGTVVALARSSGAERTLSGLDIGADSNRSYVVAIDPMYGKVLWTHPVDWNQGAVCGHSLDAAYFAGANDPGSGVDQASVKLLKLGVDGSVVFEKSFKGQATPRAIAVDGQTGDLALTVYIGGTSINFGGEDLGAKFVGDRGAAVARLTALGEHVFSKHLGGGANATVFPAFDGDGSLILTGKVGASALLDQQTLGIWSALKLSPTGGFVYTSTALPPSGGALVASGGKFFFGSDYSPASPSFTISSANSADGSLIMTKRFAGKGAGSANVRTAFVEGGDPYFAGRYDSFIDLKTGQAIGSGRTMFAIRVGANTNDYVAARQWGGEGNMVFVGRRGDGKLALGGDFRSLQIDGASVTPRGASDLFVVCDDF